LPTLNSERVLAAYMFAKNAHGGQKRHSGEPFIQHPLAATEILLALKPDEDSIVACLLHDVLRITPIELKTVRATFGDSVISLLKGLEPLSKVHYRGLERQTENLRKLFLAMAKDIRVILIKLASRLHNMRTLEFVPSVEKQQRIANETLTIYSPIASRLGIFAFKNELDTLCFKHLYPKEYSEITKQLLEFTGMQETVIHKSLLTKVLDNGDISATIEIHVRNPYSIFKKLKKRVKSNVSELYDNFELRIIVETEAQCYQVLGLIHKHWTPLSRRFKDYIEVPKTNGYQSLHTTLIGFSPKLSNQPIVVQIRTKKMNETAEFGIAAQWHYKKQGGVLTIDQKKLPWIQGLVDLHENLKNNSEFIEALSVDIFHDRIFILTPKGDVLDLPYDATPVDFAYAIHTGIGNKCRGAKVNGRIVPLDYKLKNGQVVEIITGLTEKPNRYWLYFVVTFAAKTHIKQWFNTQNSEKINKIDKLITDSKLINQKLKDNTEFIETVASGLGSVAGMKELKQLLIDEVINPLKYPEKFKKFKVSIPNGIILYGPPGCGKTFIVRKLAEELGYNFFEIKHSDLATPFIHGSVGNIGKTFETAKQNAPAIIFFDEISGLVPDRNKLNDGSSHKEEEVNEFLLQLNDAADNHVLVVGATNYIERIDPAVLRPGRFDKKIYVPPPDLEARKELFKLGLFDRPYDKKIDFEYLAIATNGFSCADIIEGIVETAARIAANQDREAIDQALIESEIKKCKLIAEKI